MGGSFSRAKRGKLKRSGRCVKKRESRWKEERRQGGPHPTDIVPNGTERYDGMPDYLLRDE